PVLILIDVNMPGKGGMAAAEQLRASCPGTHISLVTANVQNATRNRTNELGIGFMEKPITEARIHSLIKALGSTTISRQSCRRPCTRRRCRCTLTPPRAPAANACSRRWR
ncbi:MAG: response regulator, partial [Telluria sp.]